VLFELHLEGEETEAKIANVETVEVVIVYGVWTEVPSVCGVLSQLESEDCFELSDFLMSQQFCVVHSEVRVVVRMDVSGRVLPRSVLNFVVSPPDAREGHPVIVTLVEVLEVDVVTIGILISRFGGVIIYN
jgi:hypothetical protein